MPKPAKAAVWFLICGILQKGVSVITIPIFTRLLDTYQYGQYTLYSSWLEILSIVITLNLSYGVFMQGLIRYERDRDVYTSSLQALTTLLVVVFLLLYLINSAFWNSLTGLNTFMMLNIFATAWAVAMFGFWSTRQRIEYKYRALVAVTLIVAIVNPVSGIVAVISTEVLKVEARIICATVVQFVVYGAMFIYYMVKGKTLFEKQSWVGAIRFNLPLIPHYLSNSILNQSDRVMINMFNGASAAGIYGLAHQVSWVMVVVNQAISNTLSPWMLEKIKRSDYANMANTAYLLIALVGCANLLLICFAPEAIALFAPAEYDEGKWVIPPLAAGVFVMFFYAIFSNYEFYYEKTHYVMIASTTGAALNIVLNAIFLPRFGYLAAGYTTLVGYACYSVMHYVFMRRIQRAEIGIDKIFDAKILVALCACFLGIAACLMFFYERPLIRFFIAAVLLCILIANRGRLGNLLREIKDSGKERGNS